MAITPRPTSTSTLLRGPDITIEDYSKENLTDTVRIEDIESYIEQGLKPDGHLQVVPDSEDNSSLSDDGAMEEDHDEIYDYIENQDEIFGQDPEGQQRSEYKDLGTLLRRCAIQHVDKKRIKRFWPSKLLDQILTRDRIIEELRAYESDQPGLFDGESIDAFADDISRRHRKVFAILTLTGQGPCIKNIVNEGLQDRDLPLFAGGTSYQIFRGSRDLPELVQCFSSPTWHSCHKDMVLDLQYAVKPLVLNLEDDGRTPRHRNFHPKVVLPFMHEEERHRGGYGVVKEVTVHPDCHKFHKLLQSVRWSLQSLHTSY